MDQVLQELINLNLPKQVKFRIHLELEDGHNQTIRCHRSITPDSFTVDIDQCPPFTKTFKSIRKRINLKDLDQFLSDLITKFKKETEILFEITFKLENGSKSDSATIQNLLSDLLKKTDFSDQKFKLKLEYLVL